jgi:hypothetical protein
VTSKETPATRRRILRNLSPQWHEPILRLLVDQGELRFTGIKEHFATTDPHSAPQDGQITKALNKLRAFKYIQKRGGTRDSRLNPWRPTDLGKRAIKLLDEFLEGDTDGAARGTSTVAAPLGTANWGVGVSNPLEDVIDTSRPHPARRYNYWLGGKDNFPADRESGDDFERQFPTVRKAAQENRDFLGRAVRFVAGRAGVRQFIDIGPGLPTANNTHEVAQLVAPDSRVVYVDNDPMVIRHAQALLTGTEQGATAYIEQDLKDPAGILRHPALTATLDLSQPVALVLVAVLHFIKGDDAAQPIVETLLDALPSGSYLIASHGTHDFLPADTRTHFRQLSESGKVDVWGRPFDEFERLFTGLEVVEPGLVQATDWRRPVGSPCPPPEEIGVWAGVGRKP